MLKYASLSKLHFRTSFQIIISVIVSVKVNWFNYGEWMGVHWVTNLEANYEFTYPVQWSPVNPTSLQHFYHVMPIICSVEGRRDGNDMKLWCYLHCRNLPRHQFGNLQSKMFPAYFSMVGVCCAVSMGAFGYLHPWKTSTTAEKYQIGFLLAAFAFNLTNLFVFTPMTIEVQSALIL